MSFQLVTLFTPKENKEKSSYIFITKGLFFDFGALIL
jgi:hypothetical protein